MTVALGEGSEDGQEGWMKTEQEERWHCASLAMELRTSGRPLGPSLLAQIEGLLLRERAAAREEARSKLEQAERERDEWKLEWESLEEDIANKAHSDDIMAAWSCSKNLPQYAVAGVQARTVRCLGHLRKERDEARAKLERCVEALEAMAAMAESAGLSRGDQFTQEWRDGLANARAKTVAALAACRKDVRTSVRTSTDDASGTDGK